MKILGVILILIGVCLGLYVGIWLCFIGGIVNVIQAVRMEHLVAMDIAIGIVKIIFSTFLGYLSAIGLVIPGIVILND